METLYSARNTTVVDLPIDDVYPSPLNPRKHFEDEALSELAESIRRDGVMQPIVVRLAAVVIDDDLTIDGYVIVMGERRWRASKLAGRETIPAVIREGLNDADHLRLALVENLQRQDLDPIEEAEGYRQLNRVVGLKQAEIATAVNRSQPAVANAMRLLELPEEVREQIRAGVLSVSHGIALARWKDYPAAVTVIAADIVERGRTSKDVASREMNFWWHEMVRAGVVREVGYETHFDKTTCESCPFGAYRTEQYRRGGLCLKPAHYDELQASAVAAEQERFAAVIAAREADGKPVLSLKELRYDQYERIYPETCPPGCTEACSCRAVALGHADMPVAICSNPKRFKKLRATVEKEKAAAIKASVQGRVDALAAAVDALPAIRSADLALLIAPLVTSMTKGQWADIKRHTGDAIPDPLPGEWNFGADGYSLLATLSPLDLVKLGIEARLRGELRDVALGHGQGVRIGWWMEHSATADVPTDGMVACAICDTPTFVAEGVPVEIDGQEKLACAACGEFVEENQDEIDEAWAAVSAE